MEGKREGGGSLRSCNCIESQEVLETTEGAGYEGFSRQGRDELKRRPVHKKKTDGMG